MFYSLEGILTYTDASMAVVDCHGVAFKCFTTLNTLKNIGKLGSKVKLYTHLSVKEDALDLFGFSTPQELESFKLLTSVSGIGPKAAVSILSELTPERLAICIAGGDYKALTKAQGVGKKIAERAVLELKDKMAGIAPEGVSKEIEAASSVTDGSASSEAVEALVALGYQRSDAAVAVGTMDKSMTVDDMIRTGLKMLASRL